MPCHHLEAARPGLLLAARPGRLAHVRLLRAVVAWIGILLIAGLGAGCVKAPDTVYLVDRKTVLEHQAGGELTALENDLNDSAIQPRCEPFTPGELEAAGVSSGVLTVASLYAVTRSDSDRIDDLLVRRCIGEAADGLLEETPATCAGTVDEEALTRLVQRENRNRRQVWAYIQRQRPGVGEEEVRKVWRKNHLLQVVCGGQIQRDDGTWTIKRCDE